MFSLYHYGRLHTEYVAIVISRKSVKDLYTQLCKTPISILNKCRRYRRKTSANLQLLDGSQ